MAHEDFFFLFLNETLTLQKTGSSDNFDFEKRCRISKLKSRVKLIVRLQKRSKEQSPIVYLFIHQLNLCCALVISGYWYNIFFVEREIDTYLYVYMVD